MEAMSITPPRLALSQRWFVLGLAVFFVLLNLQYVVKVSSSTREHRSAFLRWRSQLQDMDAGENIWARHNYPNPPIMALILKPFAELPPLAGSLAWFYAKVAMAVLSIVWVLKMLERPDQPFPWWGKVLAVGLSLRPIEGDLVHGNVNLFILFLVVAMVYAWVHGRGFLAGLLLGLAIACKVTPALFLPYFLWKRAWSTLAGAACGLAMFILLIPAATLGWDNNQAYLASWWDNMVSPYVTQGKVTTEHVNQSLPGLAHRLLTDSASFTTHVNGAEVALEKHNLLDLDPAAVRWGLKLCMLAFAALVVWRCRTPPARRQSWAMMAEVSIVVLGMLLFSERTWKHHGVVLLLPFATLAYALASPALAYANQRYLRCTAAAAAILMLATSTGLFEQQERFGKLMQVYGAYVWAYLILLASLLYLLGLSRPAEFGDACSQELAQVEGASA